MQKRQRRVLIRSQSRHGSVPDVTNPGRERADGRSNVGSIDGPAAVRAASTGFTVLLLGGLLAPLAASLVPVVGQFALAIVAAAGFVVAGRGIGNARSTVLHGACAAVGSYLLVLPLVLWSSSTAGGVDVTQVVATAGTAVVVGGLAGHIAGRRRASATAQQ